MLMKAWNIDANTINTGEIHGSDLNNLMVVTREIRDFLSPDSKKMFIVAPKGVGKTFLLKVKSQLFRDNSSGYKFIPEETLCESFTSNDISFSENELMRFTERSIWNKTWELCLYTLILKQFKRQEIPSEIQHVIGDDIGVLNEVLGAFLQVRGQIEKLHGLVATKLKPAVRKLRENSTANQIAIFIDNIDESFDSYVGFTARSEGRLKASSIWINAQLSLLNVARDICRSNHHIKIFATVRSEAYMNFNDPLKLQIDDLCLELHYSKEELKEILIKNIKLTDKEDLVAQGNINPLVDLFGYDKIPHKFIEDDNGAKKLEDVFDFIYRHSYGRPRDLVLIGKSIVEKIKPSLRHKFSEVSKIVNEQSYRLFEQLKNETIPVFEDEIFEKFCIKVKSNVIKYEDAYQISTEFKNEEKFDNVFSYFYRLGLIGIVESNLDHEGQLKQSFLPVGKYSLTNEAVPEYQYFVLHPSLNRKMKQIFDVGFYDRFNIIGYDYPFNSQKINRLENHFHFGLDRDSITTILPTIQNTKCLAVLVPPQADWSSFETSNTFTININGQELSFQVYREDLDEHEKNIIKNSWKAKKYHVIIYSNYVEEVSFFFEKCTSFSMCLFLQHADLLQKLVSNSDLRSQTNIYLCVREFIRHEFDYQENFLRSLHRNIQPELLLLDRYQYQSETQYHPGDRVTKCTIYAESDFNVLCQNGRDSSFKNVEVISKVHNATEFDFYKRKHNYLTEGVYHFFKLLLSNGCSNEKNYKGMMEKFIWIQAIRTVEAYTDQELYNLFNGKTRDTLIREIIGFGISNQIRVEKLNHEGVLSNMTNDLISNKEKGFFPNESEFCQLINRIPEFYQSSQDFVALWKILDYNSLPGFKNIFISYSFKDAETVKAFHERFLLMGINVRRYEEDNPVVLNKMYMSSAIATADRMLFFASKHSLTSDPCHFELSLCIETIRKTGESERLIVIRLDDYVVNVDLFGIIDEVRSKNFNFLQNHASLGNKYKVEDASLRNIDNLIKEIIEKSLK